MFNLLSAWERPTCPSTLSPSAEGEGSIFFKKQKTMKLTLVGRWAVIIGIILAILAGFAEIPSLGIILFVLGLIVGFLNIGEKESTPFLIAVITLLLVGVAGLQFGAVTGTVASILENFLAFVSAAALVVALKQILGVVKPSEA